MSLIEGLDDIVDIAIADDRNANSAQSTLADGVL